MAKFFYFDLGKVLVNFSIETMCRQMGQVAGIPPQRVQEIVMHDGLLAQYETGTITGRQFHERFCRAAGTQPDYDALYEAGSAIFSLNAPMVPVVSQLAAAGHRLGILSNTSDAHWEYCRSHYRILTESFSLHALSYRIGCCKPEPGIFRTAAEMAGCRPEEIFYTDDIAGHVAGARAVGFDAVLFTSASETAAELRRRGVRFNY